MSECFVIQPYDRGLYDRRFRRVLAPAIVKAGLAPYRVDEDPTTANIHDTIHEGIKRASICLAEITQNNPNVWYEIGYAYAQGKPVLLIRSKKRKRTYRTPFDVSPQFVIEYSSDKMLAADIDKRLRALLKQPHGPTPVRVTLGCDIITIFSDRNTADFPFTIKELRDRLDTQTHTARVFVAARTAKTWTDNLNALAQHLRSGRLRLSIMLTDPSANTDLLAHKERPFFTDDLQSAIQNLRREGGGGLAGLHYLFSPTLLIDSMTLLAYKDEQMGKEEEFVLFDIYAGTLHTQHRPCIAVHHTGTVASPTCLATLMKQRIDLVFKQGTSDRLSDQAVSDVLSSFKRPEGEPSRFNAPVCLMPALLPLFDFYSSREPLIAADGVFNEARTHRHLPPPSPVCVQVELTDRCNVHRCAGCTRGRSGSQLDPGVFAQLLGSLETLRSRNLILSGGEPLLHPQIGHLLSLAAGHGFNLALLTDGLALHHNDDLARSVVENVSSVRLSFDGSTPDTYRRIRHLRAEHPAFHNPVAVVEGVLARLHSERQRNSAARLKHVGVCTTLFEENAGDVLHIWEWAKRQPIDSLVFKFSHGTPDTIGEHGQPFTCSARTVEKVGDCMRQIAASRQFGPPHVNAQYLQHFIGKMGREQIARGKPTDKLYEKERLVCFTPLLFALVAPDGEVYRCCHSYFDNSSVHAGRANNALGCIGTDDFRDIWGTTAHKRVAQANRWDSAHAELLCSCPCRDECVRHWTHNSAITQVYRAYVKLGPHAKSEFREAFQRQMAALHPPDAFWL